MTKETSLPAKQRIWELDALRGLCILCMVAIHAFWDLSAFGGFAFDLPGWFLFCRQYGHILFILLSGLCATLASRSFQRGVYVFGAALVISYVTFFMVNVLNFPSDMLIWFGILHMLGVCMMLFPLFKRLPVWALAVLGIALLGGAYWLAVSIRQPLEALTWFFVAVIMVIVGTYLLFIAGSVALCRMLQKNPRYYYQPRHFVSVSSMAYRMKRNGAGLASICVLATMVLVMLSSTTCMYYGVEDALRQRYPRDIGVECYFGDRLDQMDEAHLDILRAAVADAADAMGSSRDNVQDYRAAWLYGILTPDGALRSVSDSGGPASEMTRVTLIPLPDYNALTGTELTLSDGEVFVYGHRMTYTAPQFTVGDTTWRVKSLLDRCAVNGASAADVTPSLYVVVPDFESAARLLLDLSANSDLSVQLRWYYQFDSDLPDDAQYSSSASYETDGVPANLTDALEMALYSVNAETDLTTGWEVESLAANRSDFYGAYGGLFFLGIMLSVVFSLAAVSIIYYKQVCEGYEDQSRFAIMQKVGMTKRDIRRSINSQLLTVFFLPMALSGVHLCFAFPFIHKLLLLFNLSNTSLLIGTTVVSYVAFALLYTLAYKLTSNAYYHIVSGAAERE